MRARKVMDILQISRSTLKRYRDKGILKATELPTGQFEFDDDSVYLLKNKKSKRLTLIYGRVSTYKQKKDLNNQIQELTNWAKTKDYEIDGVYQDIASDISFKNRKQFFKMLDLILEGKVKKVIITNPDRLSRTSFELLKYIFNNFSTEIEVVSNIPNSKTDEQELFKEIISFLNSFSTKKYSKHRKEHELIEETLKKNIN